MSTRFYVTTGPESSGKTTLAGQLADYYRAPLVTEISREYLQKKMSAERHWRYDQNDLLTIAKQQNQLELNLGAYDPQAIVCDTDLLVLIVWSEVKYGISDPWINKT
ncbi:MAG: ATP-binding protein, partial [Pseudohongiellaceae bacterium]